MNNSPTLVRCAIDVRSQRVARFRFNAGDVIAPNCVATARKADTTTQFIGRRQDEIAACTYKLK